MVATCGSKGQIQIHIEVCPEFSEVWCQLLRGLVPTSQKLGFVQNHCVLWNIWTFRSWPGTSEKSVPGSQKFGPNLSEVGVRLLRSSGWGSAAQAFLWSGGRTSVAERTESCSPPCLKLAGSCGGPASKSLQASMLQTHLFAEFN